MKIYVQCENELEVLGVASTLDKDHGYSNVSSTSWKGMIGLIVNSETKRYRYIRANSGQLPESVETTMYASDGIEVILEALKPAIPLVDETVVFDYHSISKGKSKRVLIVKEESSAYLKGLDVLDDFQFKAFLRTGISNLKLVKAQ